MRSIDPAAAPPASRRRRLSLPRQAWPRADRAAWERALSPASLLDDEGVLAASWRPRSREAVLLDLGTTMMEEGQAGTASDPVPAARLYRDGLIIAFLALIPLRRGNLVALEIGRQLARSSGGWIVAIPGEETKNHRPLVFTLPDALAAALDTYLAVHRPVLLAQRRGGGTAGLWLGATGRPLSAIRVWRVVTRHTRQRLGVAVNPHLFRDCAATLLGDVDPANVLLAAPLLGHSDFRTTEGHYILAQTRGAFRAHHDLLESMRRRAAQGRARKVASQVR